MMQKLIVLCCVLFVCTSCYKFNAPEKPDNLISKDKMTYILLDLKLINAVTGRDKKVLDSAKVYPEGYVYKKYKIDSIQFAKSNAYYTYYMEDYTEIYAKVKDSLLKLKAHYDAILEQERKEKKIADSLKTVKKELDALELDEEIFQNELDDTELIAPASDKDSLSLKSRLQ